MATTKNHPAKKTARTSPAKSGQGKGTTGTRGQGKSGTSESASTGKATASHKTSGTSKTTGARKGTGSHKSTGTSSGRKWSADVTEHSNALDLKKGVFTSDDPKKIARSVEKSAEESHRKKGSSHQSAMSMLNFYINRAGKNLPAGKKKVLNQAKDQLKEKSDKKD